MVEESCLSRGWEAEQEKSERKRAGDQTQSPRPCPHDPLYPEVCFTNLGISQTIKLKIKIYHHKVLGKAMFGFFVF